MWSRFWDSFGSTDHNESESQLSDPLSSQMLSTHSGRELGRAISPEPSASFSQLQGFSEITPNESASMVNNEESRSLSSSHHLTEPKDNMFSFKFTTTSGKTHRIASNSDSYSQLVDSVCQKVIGEHMAHVDAEDTPVDSWLSISYLDDEEDQVLITSDADVSDAVNLARKMGQNRVKLFVHDTTERAPEVPAVVVEAPVEAPVVEEVKEAPKPRSVRKQEEEKPVEPAFPQELILPAAIAFLGVVIIGVFAFSRVSPQHR
jgi:hypothetical protein